MNSAIKLNLVYLHNTLYMGQHFVQRKLFVDDLSISWTTNGDSFYATDVKNMKFEIKICM